LRRPLDAATISVISTAGVHPRSESPFDLYSDATYRVIPAAVQPDELQITHRAYDRRDAARDINIIFPLPRLRELAADGIIGTVAAEHYGFGLTVEPEGLLESGRELASAWPALVSTSLC
jgi:D-proline reductase (dithiol) PrdB